MWYALQVIICVFALVEHTVGKGENDIKSNAKESLFQAKTRAVIESDEFPLFPPLFFFNRPGLIFTNFIKGQ